MTIADDVLRLRKMIDDVAGTIYSDAELEAYLVTYNNDFNAVAAVCWGDRASTIWSTHYNFSADGANYSLGDVYKHCIDRAKYYASKRKPTTTLWVKDPEELDNGLFIDENAIVNETDDEVF